MKKILFLFILGIIGIGCNETPEITTELVINEITLDEVVNMHANQATWVPRDAMKSRNGASMGYGVVLNPNSNKLIIFLDGGGACFNGFTCNFNPSKFTESDFYNRIAVEKSLILNQNSDSNQFKGWNIIFVPYATGDVHSSKNASVHVPNNGPSNQVMVGGNNIEIILQDLKPYFDAKGGVTEIVFAGSSAGAFGVLTNFKQVKDVFVEDIPTSVIVDAGQIFTDESVLTPCLIEQWMTIWNLADILPADLNSIVKQSYNYDIYKIYEYLSLKYPDVNFGFLSYYEDSTNRLFYGFGQNNCFYPPSGSLSAEKFKNGLLDLKTNVLDKFDNWKVFYANGTTHTFLNDANFSQTVNGTTLNDWISQLRQGNALDLVD